MQTISIHNELLLQQAALASGLNHEKTVEAALKIMLDLLKYPEILEELQDIAEAEQILEEIKSGTTKTISWEQIKLEAGL